MISKLWAVCCRLVLMIASIIAGLGLATLGYSRPELSIPLAIGLMWKGFRKVYPADSHGSARTATLGEMQAAGLLQDHGLILGATLPASVAKIKAVAGLFSFRVRSDLACRMFLAAFLWSRWSANRFIRTSRYVHMLTVGQTGSGKGTSVLVPNLLSYPGSCVITDPKGELYKLTADHRRKAFGHRIIRIDPFGIGGPGGDTLNPFDFINPESDDFLDQCRDLGNMLIVRQSDEKDPHWSDSAELNLTAFTAFVCGCEGDPAQRNLQTVRKIASSRGSYGRAVEVMQQVKTHQGVIARLGGLLTWFTGEEQGSVLTTFQRHTAFLDSPVIARNTATSSFDPMILRTGRATVYLCLPHDRLQSLAALQRMWIGVIMRRITRGKADEATPVLWLLDEVAHLSRLTVIEEAATLMRGMGIRLWLFVQSLDQLKTCFGEKATTVLDNVGTQQYFAINSYPTAEELSKRIGDATISVRQVNNTWSRSHPTGGDGKQGGNVSASSSVTTSDIARRLLKPEEILVLPEDVTLIFHRNMPVIVGRLIRYFSAPEFRKGRSGRQRGLGLTAGALAVMTLLSSVAFAAIATAWSSRSRIPMEAIQSSPYVRDAHRRRSYAAPSTPYRRRSGYGGSNGYSY